MLFSEEPPGLLSIGVGTQRFARSKIEWQPPFFARTHFGHRLLCELVFTGTRQRRYVDLRLQIKALGHEIEFRFHDHVPGDFDSRIGGFSGHDGGHGAFRHGHGAVDVRTVADDAVDHFDVFIDVRADVGFLAQVAAIALALLSCHRNACGEP